MSTVERVDQLLHRIAAAADWQFALGVHIRFANPTLTYHSYPATWIDLYDRKGYRDEDPAVRWGLTHRGTCDWADLVAEDRAGVFAEAAEYGLRHGFVASTGEADSRTMGFFARADRPFSAAEVAKAAALLDELHTATIGVERKPEAEIAALRALQLSVLGIAPPG